MPLVLLKRSIFGATARPTPAVPSPTLDKPGAKRDADRPATQSSSEAATEADIESQTSANIDKGFTSVPASSGRFNINARVISDATIGLADGLTVPFALTAGLSALGNTKVVIFGGLAELIAGAISMGLGGYLGAKSEAASYVETRRQTEDQIRTDPASVVAGLQDVFAPYELPAATLQELTTHLSLSPRLVDFVMQFQHCSEAPAAHRAFTSALTIALGYFLGGLLPLIPYFCVGQDALDEGLYISIGVMAFALFTFGCVKTCAVCGWRGWPCVSAAALGGVQMVVVGGVAAGAAMGLVKAFNGYVNASSM